MGWHAQGRCRHVTLLGSGAAPRGSAFVPDDAGPGARGATEYPRACIVTSGNSYHCARPRLYGGRRRTVVGRSEGSEVCRPRPLVGERCACAHPAATTRPRGATGVTETSATEPAAPQPNRRFSPPWRSRTSTSSTASTSLHGAAGTSSHPGRPTAAARSVSTSTSRPATTRWCCSSATGSTRGTCPCAPPGGHGRSSPAP